MKNKAYIFAFCALLALGPASAEESAVRAWEEGVEIPTYVLGAPEAAPIFCLLYTSDAADD